MGASRVLAGAWLAVGPLATPAAADDACRTVLADRIRTCTEQCIAKAKAAVDPEVRDRILGYGCASNCAKLEMFNGHVCPPS